MLWCIVLAVQVLACRTQHSVQSHGPGTWAPWRVRTVALPKLGKTVDVFGIVHHNLYVADQAAEFVKARRPDEVLIEQDPEGTRISIQAYKNLIKTGKRSVLNIWEWATHIDGMDGRMRNRFVTGFDGKDNEDYAVFEAMEAIGLDPENVVPGDLNRDVKQSGFSTADVSEEEAWWHQGCKHGNTEAAWEFAETTIQEWKAIDFSKNSDPQAGGLDLERRRTEYFSFFDAPMEFCGMEARPRIIRARENHMAKQALSSLGVHVAMIVGASHIDGIEAALLTMDGKHEL